MLKSIIKKVKESDLVEMVSEKVSEVVNGKNEPKQINDCVVLDVDTKGDYYLRQETVKAVSRNRKIFSEVIELPSIKAATGNKNTEGRIINRIEVLKDRAYSNRYILADYIQMSPQTYYNILSALDKTSNYGNYENSSTFTTEHNKPTICGLIIEYVDCYKENFITVSSTSLKEVLGWKDEV